ncbi:hypothetical protein, partial [Porphyrobacter sp. TH134]|uniref:hypothetical protein n=1 Tax=Porphyrobacter sp. TH134 TaxID=2067450 RepID=UPI001F26C887
QPLSAKPLHPKRESDFTPNGNPLIPTFATGLFWAEDGGSSIAAATPTTANAAMRPIGHRLFFASVRTCPI